MEHAKEKEQVMSAHSAASHFFILPCAYILCTPKPGIPLLVSRIDITPGPEG